MFKTYLRLLGFARPIEKYAIPYFFYSLLYALFNSLTFMLIIPILNTMFDEGFTPEPVETLPPIRRTWPRCSTTPTRTCSTPTTGRTC